MMELLALPEALSRVFRSDDAGGDADGGFDHEFFPIWDIDEDRPFAGFTSNPLPPPAEADVQDALGNIVAEVAGRLVRREGEDPDDLMIVIFEDVELGNMAQPDRITAAVRAAVDRHATMTTPPPGVDQNHFEDRIRSAFRNKVSFHLAAPMIESWLFADPAGPARAGMNADRKPMLIEGRDPEDFCTNDDAYVDFDELECLKWAKLQAQRHAGRRLTRSKIKAGKPAWVGEFDRRLHPKAYLAWLCRDPTQKRCSTYRETRGKNQREECGQTALGSLVWRDVLSRRGQCTFVRALVADLAKHLGVDNPYPGDVHSLTCRKTAGQVELVLRNLSA